MVNRINVFGIICLLVLMCSFNCVMTAHAATPRVMLEDYNVKEGQVVSGRDFTLEISVKNYSAKQVKNLKVTISTENGDFIPVDNAGSMYIESIDGGETYPVSFKMKANEGLEEKSYKVNVVTDYENPTGHEYRSEEEIFLPVSLEQRLSVTDLFIDGEECVVGDTVEISASINNMGEGELYNVMAHIEGDNIASTDSYVGTIEKGKSGNMDLLTKADVVTEGEHKKNVITITYENKAREEFSQKIEIGVHVNVPVYENIEKVRDKGDTSYVWKALCKIILAAAVIAVILYALYRRQKRKQRILDEFVN